VFVRHGVLRLRVRCATNGPSLIPRNRPSARRAAVKCRPIWNETIVEGHSLSSEPRSVACARSHEPRTYMHCDRMAGGALQFALTSLRGAMMSSIGMM
jgi:hypothetical protein